MIDFLSMLDTKSSEPVFDAMDTWLRADTVKDAQDAGSEFVDALQATRRKGDILPWLAREIFVQRFGFCLPDPGLFDALRALGPFLEIGAGSGYLTRLGRNLGLDIIATDLEPGKPRQGSDQRTVYAEIDQLSAEDAVQKYPDRHVLCSWPSYGETWIDDAARALRPGQILIYIGEGPGGCCAPESFFELASDILEPVALYGPLNHQPFGIHDEVFAGRRKPV